MDFGLPAPPQKPKKHRPEPTQEVSVHQYGTGWTPEQMDKFYDALKKKKGSDLSYTEMREEAQDFLGALQRGNYRKDVRNLTKYRAHRAGQLSLVDNVLPKKTEAQRPWKKAHKALGKADWRRANP